MVTPFDCCIMIDLAPQGGFVASLGVCFARACLDKHKPLAPSAKPRRSTNSSEAKTSTSESPLKISTGVPYPPYHAELQILLVAEKVVR